MQKAAPRGRRSALVVVDMQNDHCGDVGSERRAQADAVAAKVNMLRSKVKFEVVALTQDW
jgi:nicotinamidase-related amidase